MNRNTIKTFAIWARRYLRETVTTRLAYFGVTAKDLANFEVVSGGVLVAGNILDKEDGKQYQALREYIDKMGQKSLKERVEAVIDEIAYTWFNRLVALRYMEVNGYIGRVLSSSHPQMVDPDILREAGEIADLGDIKGLDYDKLTQWRKESENQANSDEYIYRRLLLCQCDALGESLPFLFGGKGFLGLFLPSNLLNQDSIIRKLVADIPEEEWEVRSGKWEDDDESQDVEIIGWLYQYYISERKDEVIGAKSQVKASDIPPATQLFTPHWIVRYMVENSLGRLWLEAHPESKLGDLMKYYVESGKWEVESGKSNLGGEENDRQKLSRVDSLAKGDGFGGVSLPSHKDVSEGGTLRFNESNTAGSSINPVQYSGGANSSIDGGIQAFSVNRTGFKGGVGNSNSHRPTSPLSQPTGSETHTQSSGRNQTDALFSDSQTQVTTSHSPLSTPHSPQDLTVCDPACGSGHILVYAFSLLVEIYREQGYSDREIPSLILTHNLYGLDIDERAVQLTCFALFMKARALDKRIFRREVKLKIAVVKPSHRGMLPSLPELVKDDWFPLLDCFQDAECLGSLITPWGSGEWEVGSGEWGVGSGESRLGKIYGHLWEQLAICREVYPAFASQLQGLEDILLQSELLGRKYGVVVANPPYMGNKSLNPTLKEFIDQNYRICKGDLFAPFIKRCLELTLPNGLMSNINQHSWMFLSSFESLRQDILENYTIINMIHLGIGVFPELNSKVVQSTAFILSKNQPSLKNSQSVFIRLVDEYSVEWKKRSFFDQKYHFTQVNQADFKKIPGSAIAYWVSEKLLKIFETSEKLGNIASPVVGLQTGSNDRFLRYWFEVNLNNIGFGFSNRQEAEQSKKRWFPYNKGGEFRKWYGNQEYLVNWEKDGLEIRNFGTENGGKSRSRPQNTECYFKASITWSFVSSSFFGVRKSDQGFIFDVGGSSLFTDDKSLNWLTGLLCSNTTFDFMTIMNPTLNFQVGNVANIPVIENKDHVNAGNIAEKCIEISRQDWDNFETSWDFKRHPLIVGSEKWEVESEELSVNDEQNLVNNEQLLENSDTSDTLSEDINKTSVGAQGLRPQPQGLPIQPHPNNEPSTIIKYPLSITLEQAFNQWQQQTENAFNTLKQLEEENNRYWIDAYGLQDELTPDVPDEQITIRKADLSRDIRSLLSYFVGCLMGRYSLDKEGLICAGEVGSGEWEVGSREEGENKAEKVPFSKEDLGGSFPSEVPFSKEDLGGSFPMNKNGIIPITDTIYFEDDIITQFIQFLKVVYPPESLNDNLKFIANALNPKSNDTPLETIRRYFITDFITDHIKTYKKRPIYWLFTSGKKRAFGALVYLHRYDDITIGRIRTDYVLPLQLKLNANIEQLQKETEILTTTTAKKQAQKELKRLQEQQAELRDYQAKLQRFADQRIQLDLDDGVAYNYTRFKGIIYEGSELKIKALEKAAKWKLDLLKEQK